MIGIRSGIIQPVLNYVRENTFLINARNVPNYLNVAVVAPFIKMEKIKEYRTHGRLLEEAIVILRFKIDTNDCAIHAAKGL